MRIYKLKAAAFCDNYKTLLYERLQQSAHWNTIEHIWADLKSCLLDSSKDTCDLTRGGQLSR